MWKIMWPYILASQKELLMEGVGKQSGCVCPADEYTWRAERARERRDLREKVYVVELIVKDWFFREKEK
jgi:hypothetical protein